MRLLLAMLLFCTAGWTQSATDSAVVVNSRDAKWQHDSDDPPGGESLMLRMDKKSGAMEFFAKYPGGYASKLHAHEANERFLLMEGKVVLEAGESKSTLEAGAFAYIPAGRVHRISCASATACVWYLAWDGKP